VFAKYILTGHVLIINSDNPSTGSLDLTVFREANSHPNRL